VATQSSLAGQELLRFVRMDAREIVQKQTN
jgi:hypothetical protein